jgi:hypothetical protein
MGLAKEIVNYCPPIFIQRANYVLSDVLKEVRINEPLLWCLLVTEEQLLDADLGLSRLLPEISCGLGGWSGKQRMEMRSLMLTLKSRFFEWSFHPFECGHFSLISNGRFLGLRGELLFSIIWMSSSFIAESRERWSALLLRCVCSVLLGTETSEKPIKELWVLVCFVGVSRGSQTILEFKWN